MRRSPAAPAPIAGGGAPETEALDSIETDEAVTETAAPETLEAAPAAPAEIEAEAPAEAAAPAESEPKGAVEAPEPAAVEAAAQEVAAQEAAPAEAPEEIAEDEAEEPVHAASEEPAEPVTEAPAEEPVTIAAAAPALAALATEIPAAAAPEAPEAAKAQGFAYSFSFKPTYLDVEGIGTILLNYVQTESAAALSHMRALGEVRTPADMIRLNVTEMQRAADASLTCWIAVARRASRPVSAH